MSKYPFQENDKKENENICLSREYILLYLKKFGQPISRNHLVQQLNLNNTKQLRSLKIILRSLESDNQIIFTRNQHYILTENSNILHGKIIGHRDGYGFLSVLNKEDIYLSPEQMKNYIHGDIVLAQVVVCDCHGRQEAKIIKILEPYKNVIIGRYLIESGVGFVVPNDNHFHFNILISLEKSMNAKVGCIVVIKLIQRPTRHFQAKGEVIEILGYNMGTKLAIKLSLKTHEIPYVWPFLVKEEIIKFSSNVVVNNYKNRVDLRKLPFVTIDDEDACDLDDAIYCEKLFNDNSSWRLWIAIADVSHYVLPNSAIDKEASIRGNSVYFPCKIVVPMLPEILSNNICSLKPKLDRLCLVCEILVSSDGQITNFKHYEAVINSCARLTYDKAYKILKGDKKLCNEYSILVMHLKELNNMYCALEYAKNQRGSLIFEKEEVKFIFNKKNRIARIEKIFRNDVHKIIEECMILANVASALFLEKNAEPILFRDHDSPSNENIMNFRVILNELGLQLTGGESPRSIDYAMLLKKIYHRPDADMIQTMLLRSMKQAVYDVENRGHFGLALNAYAHFTSPIRRYPDLLLHRSIKYLIGIQQNSKTLLTGKYHYTINSMETFAKHCSMTERRADLATRDVSDWLKCDFMQDKLGKIFEGIISNVTNFGFFVKLNELYIEGLVHVSKLHNDYYNFDHGIQRLVGQSTNIIYKIGDVVKIKVISVKIDERKIDFELFAPEKNSLFNTKKNIHNNSKFYKKNKLFRYTRHSKIKTEMKKNLININK